ncbi:fungal-specific transcription factor domain-containing protein [Dioszegia hungarica]|uniref:Fungal-specific transcription factor domain-containing protein n=1 Tax=Dioszegia hungarica TaxID=4972 RepID=A0AA38H9U9_9TREE|nr:fungal-specific transcription factor domain-containing protein [Dioszegia hungarica]KAI9637142.1 fungal-specific transcription factor domain-containing protein [Dioszegia hungarica]
MSAQIDYAEISRHARRIVDANRAQAVVDQVMSQADTSSDSAPPTAAESSTSRPPKKLNANASGRKAETGRSRRPTIGRGVSEAQSATRQESSEADSAMDGLVGGQAPLAPPQAMQSGGVGETDVLLAAATQQEYGAGLMGMVSGNDGSGQWAARGWAISPPQVQAGGSRDYLMGMGMGNHSSPDLSFLNDLFAFTPAPTLPPLETSPSQILPINFLAPTPAPTSQTDPLPQFANLNKSRLLARRTANQNMAAPAVSRGISPLSNSTVHPRMLLIETILQASEFDDSLFEFGPSGRVIQSLPGSSRGFGGTDVLSNAFSSPSARTLFHHYCNVSARFLVTMGNIGPNPLVTLCTPSKLLDTSSAASAAIRMSLLSTSMAHFTYETVDLVGAANLGRNWASTRARLDAVGRKFKKAALSNIFMAETTETSPEAIDSILAACTFICIRDVISADPTWADNMEFVLKLAHKKGGPQAMLKTTNGASNFTRRYLLENLATHDVFSCFSTGKEPALLGNYDCWWFESVETSQTRWEWESVERTFGISRAMVELVARVVTLDSRKRRLGIVMSDHPEEMMVIGQHFIRESHCLLLEADIWGNSLSALPQHHRVTCGDYIYKYMTVVLILADILEQPISTPRIAQSVDSILELCSEATAMRMSVMLTWPLLIAGLYCLPEKREKVSSLFDAFQYDYCEDLRCARSLLEEQWRLIEAGHGPRPWREVMKKLDKHAMLI